MAIGRSRRKGRKMSEIQQLKRQMLTNDAKSRTLTAYGEVFKRSLFKLAEDLARDGYSKDEIAEAIRATLPTLEAGIAQVQTDVDRIMGEFFANA
jgi:hypothetical protein